MIEACQSPVWDTASPPSRCRRGPAADHPAVVKAPTGCSASRSSAATGRCAGRGSPPAAGRSSSTTTTTPTSTTPPRSSSRCAGSRTPTRSRLGARRRDRGVALDARHAVQDGGWGAFDADNTSPLPNRLPFCDFGEVIDPPSADVTAHVVEMLAHEGRAATRAPGAASTGCWPNRSRTAPGSAAGASTTSTAPAPSVPALVAAGLPGLAPGDPPGRPLAGERPERDGGWGEDLRSYPDPASGSGAAPPPPPRPPGRCSRCWRRGSARARRSSAGSAGSPRPSGRTAPGTSRTSPAPASPGTSPSTTTSTGWSSRSPRSAGTSRRGRPGRGRGGPDGRSDRPLTPGGPAADRLRARHRAARAAQWPGRGGRRAGHRAAHRHGPQAAERGGAPARSRRRACAARRPRRRRPASAPGRRRRCTAGDLAWPEALRTAGRPCTSVRLAGRRPLVTGAARGAVRAGAVHIGRRHGSDRARAAAGRCAPGPSR